MRLFTFWSFAPLSYIERVCLASMIAAGHQVALYTYDRGTIGALPRGVVAHDAQDILSRDRLIGIGKPSIVADLFRYAGLRSGLGTWVDTDVLFLKSIADLDQPILGWESYEHLNNAVLALPPDSPFFRYVDRLAGRVPIDPRWSLGKVIKQYVRASIGRHRTLDQLPWGAIGPAALTRHALQSGLAKYAQPIDVFYPVGWRDADQFFEPTARVEASFTERTRTVHLWNERIKKLKTVPPPDNSFIGRMCAQFDVVPTPPPG
jgi:hypothetical protein